MAAWPWRPPASDVDMETTYPPRHTLPPDVANALRSARLDRRLSLRAAARRVGIPHGYLCALEQGKRCPSLAVAQDLVDGLQLKGDLAERLLRVALPDKGRSRGGAWAQRARARARHFTD